MPRQHHGDDYLHGSRNDQLYEPHLSDPYQARKKWHEPTACPDCGAVYHQGRWQWIPIPDQARSQRCPACARIHDHLPAGLLILEGDFYRQHQAEILNLVRNLASREKNQHPMERIMDIDESEKSARIQFTGIHLTRGIGEAIHHAYQGDLSIDHGERDDQMRVRWVR